MSIRKKYQIEHKAVKQKCYRSAHNKIANERQHICDKADSEWLVGRKGESLCFIPGVPCPRVALRKTDGIPDFFCTLPCGDLSEGGVRVFRTKQGCQARITLNTPALQFGGYFWPQIFGVLAFIKHG